MGNQPSTGALQQHQPAPAEMRPAVLLVIQSQSDCNYDWPAIFDGCCLEDGRSVQVVQCGWDEMLVAADSPHTQPKYRLSVHIKKGRTVNQISCCAATNAEAPPTPKIIGTLYSV